VTVTPGVSDGTNTEIVSGAPREGALVVTRAAAAAPASATANNPLLPSRR
jgi:hypothetical protein